MGYVRRAGMLDRAVRRNMAENEKSDFVKFLRCMSSRALWSMPMHPAFEKNGCRVCRPKGQEKRSMIDQDCLRLKSFSRSAFSRVTAQGLP